MRPPAGLPSPARAQRAENSSAAVGHGPADDRPAETIAAEIAHTTPEQDEGDSGTPADLDEDLRRFVDAVTDVGGRERDGGWLGGLREYVPDAGPVPSNRFLLAGVAVPAARMGVDRGE